jgi:DNA-binding NarL/FixJ family response regulator
MTSVRKVARVFLISVEDNDRLLPAKDKTVGRRIKVAQLYSQGMIQTRISMKVQASLSTVEKDIRFIKKNSEWKDVDLQSDSLRGVKKW